MGLYCCFQPISEDQVHRFSAGSAIDELDEVLEEAEGGFDLDKAWHSLHFLLTGDADKGAEPLCYILHGGKQIDGVPESEDDTGRILTIDQVVNFDNALASIDANELRSRFNVKDMRRNQIYPNIWGDDQLEESLDYIVDNFEQFKVDIAKTVRDGKGLLVFIG